MARKGENIFKRKDGRWEARYIKGHNNGKAIYGYVFGKTYSEVKTKKLEAIKTLTEQPPKKVVLSAQPLLKDLSNTWLNELKTVRKNSTISKYQNQLNCWIIPAFGNKPINAITNQDIVTFADTLLTNKLPNGKSLSPKSVADILSRMKAIRKYAILHGYDVQYMPECVTISQTPKSIRVLTLAEEDRLIRYLTSNLDLTCLGILICLFTGLRIGELCALMWQDISLEKQELYVRRTLQRVQNHDENTAQKTYIDINEPKSNCSVRTIPIPNIIWASLKHSYTEGAYVLTGSPELFIEPRTMENRFKAILKKCGIEEVNFHVTRHTFATRCVEAGFDIKSLSEILGHSSIEITLNCYVHPTMQLKRKNMDKLSELFAVK